MIETAACVVACGVVKSFVKSFLVYLQQIKKKAKAEGFI
jgi:hypothetical protein